MISQSPDVACLPVEQLSCWVLAMLFTEVTWRNSLRAKDITFTYLVITFYSFLFFCLWFFVFCCVNRRGCNLMCMCVRVCRLIFVQLCVHPRGLLEICTISVVFFWYERDKIDSVGTYCVIVACNDERSSSN